MSESAMKKSLERGDIDVAYHVTGRVMVVLQTAVIPTTIT